MELSEEWTEWHLTPNGWERGTTHRDFSGTTERPDPPGSVAVYEYREAPSSIYSRADRECDRIRLTGTKEEARLLLAQHGPCPEKL
jgi:hypothetical protein